QIDCQLWCMFVFLNGSFIEMVRSFLFTAAALLACTSLASAGLVNPGFEYGQAPGTVGFHNDASINPAGGWFTTESDHQIEVWGSGFNGVAAYQGNNFVELNAYAVGTLYQNANGIQTGDTVDYHFAHRGRAGVDTMQLNIKDITTGGTVLFSNNYSDGTTAWGFYSGSFTVGAGVAATDVIEFSYISISSVGGATFGNFLDDADFGIGVNSGPSSVPEPSTVAMSVIGAIALLGAKFRRRKVVA
ncbi:MAG: PEP-CTERM sorting domain-containing protein, partial [Schlesneria sp.]